MSVGDVVYDGTPPAFVAVELSTSFGHIETLPLLLDPATAAAGALLDMAKSACADGNEGGEFVGSV